MQLYYATDFADRLENQMLPALHAGFIVLTDRYIYSAIARAVVRGADPEWIRAIYGLALVPDAIFYLRVRSAEELAGRVLASGRGFDYWESGMDLGLQNDYYDSFIAYQKLLLKEFDRMSGEYGFEVVDASRPVKRVATALRKSISRVIDDEPVTAPTAREIVKTEMREKARSAIVATADGAKIEAQEKVKSA
jgi:dTMP kinase